MVACTLAICISFMTVALRIRALNIYDLSQSINEKKILFEKKSEDRKSNLVSILSSVFMYMEIKYKLVDVTI